MIKRTGRCLCGLKIAYHFDAQNRKLSCENARQLHPRATIARLNWRSALMRVVK